MLGLGAIGQFAIGQAGGETIFADKWFVPLSEPARFLPGLRPSAMQFIAFHPNPVVSFSWFEPLSEPPRAPIGLKPSVQQFMAYSPNPLTIIPFNWFEALSEPPRSLPGLRPGEVQFLAAPSQLRPTPKVFASLAATEKKDVFLGGARVWLRILSGEIGVIETNFTGAEIGIVEMPASAGASGIIEQQASPATGSPISQVTTAHVSIRIL